MKYSYEYQLVLQWPAVSLRDYDELIELESRIISEIGTLAEVDGHDMGVGEMNISFIPIIQSLRSKKSNRWLEQKTLCRGGGALHRAIPTWPGAF